MKRIYVAMSLALLVSLALGTAVYAASGHDYAKGNVDQGDIDWRFRVTSKFNGTQPSGTIRATYANNHPVWPNLVVTADVTCLTVVNGRFEARGVVTDVRGDTSSFVSPFEEEFVIITGSDEGKFSTTPDTFTGFHATVNVDPETCPLSSLDRFRVEDGEIVVHDS